MEDIKLKSIVLVLVLTLLITCMPSIGYAEEDNLDKNIQKIRTLFEIGQDYEDYNKHEYDSYDGNKVTSFNWGGKNSYINVNIDEEGNITGYSKGEYSTSNQASLYKFPKTTREQGREAARDFIKKLYPNILDKIKPMNEDELYNIYGRDNLRGYNYNYVMVENDIVFNENTIYINVDNQTGEVTSFNIIWNEDLEFPDTESILSKDQAKEIYINNIDLELAYEVKETDKDVKSYLGYNIINTDKTVDAKTKDMVATSYKFMYSVYWSLSNQNMERLSIEEENKLVDSKKVITRKEVSEMILDTFKLGEGYEVSDHKLKCNKEKDAYIWEVMVMKHVGNHGSGVSAGIDAKTGEILNFSDPGSFGEDSEQLMYTKEELFERAKEILKSNYPEKYKEVEYIEEESADLAYGRNNISNFLFIRKANDIKVKNEGFRVALSNVTGNVISYDYNWSNSEFETPENIIEKDKAKEILLEDKDLKLEYQTEKNEKDNKNVKIVYDFKDKHLVVDAIKAEVIDNRKELMERTGLREYKDIENSFAKEQIQKLQKYITLFEGEEFKPKQDITQKEFFQLLTQTKDIYSHQDISYLYESFIREGILKEEEKSMESKVTREEAVKYIIRTFGQEPLDNIGNIYLIEYKDADDISDNLRGHIAIAKGLGLINGEGNFRPKDNLKREEAVVLMYNILNRDI